MTDAVSTQTPTSLVPFMGTGQSIDSRDIVLPIATIRQNSYRKEEMKKFQGGDIVMRPGLQKIGDEKAGAYFVPVSCEKAYRVCDMTKGEARTVRYESAQYDLPLTFEEDGRIYRRDRCFIAHVLFRESLDAQATLFERVKKGEPVDPDDFVLPCRIIFARASLQAGKILNTHFEMSKALNGQSPAKMTFVLKTVEQKNDKGNWYAFDVAKAPKDLKFTSDALLPSCDFWVHTMAKSQFKAHEAEEEVAETVSVPTMGDDARF